MSNAVAHQLALSRAKAGDLNGALAALDAVLAGSPQDLTALLIKGDVLAGAGEQRGAASAYRLALAAARAAGAGPSPALQRAQTYLAMMSAQLEEFLRADLMRQFAPSMLSCGRFGHALDLIVGRRQVYHQQPIKFHYPELAQRQFFEREEFAWLGAIEDETAAIRADLDAVLQRPAQFQPYVEGDIAAPSRDRTGMVNNPNWSAHFLVKYGARQAAHADAARATMAALHRAPLAEMPHRGPSILFSALQAKTHIPPHNGFLNTRLICHLPLIVPGSGALRVGNETRAWTLGQALVFDDSIEHEAWNGSDQLRVVLIFDIWRPELSAEERAMINALFGALDSFVGEAPNWTE